MTEVEEALRNPFSRETTYFTFLENMENASRLRAEIQKARAEGTGTDRELVLKAAEALGMLTDNTILYRIVSQALAKRDRPAGEEPTGDVSTGETPAGDYLTGDPSTGDTPAGDSPTGDPSTGETPAEDPPAGDASKEESPTGDASKEDSPAGDASTGNVPAGDAPAGNSPMKAVPAGDASTEETP